MKTWNHLRYSEEEKKKEKRTEEVVQKQGSYRRLKIVTYCTFGARVRKTAGARSCCIPELLAQKGLIKDNWSLAFLPVIPIATYTNTRTTQRT